MEQAVLIIVFIYLDCWVTLLLCQGIHILMVFFLLCKHLIVTVLFFLDIFFFHFHTSSENFHIDTKKYPWPWCNPDLYCKENFCSIISLYGTIEYFLTLHRKFRVSILQTGEGEGFEVRTHYLKMRPEIVIQEILEKFKLLLITTKMSHKASGRPSKLTKVIEV